MIPGTRNDGLRLQLAGDDVASLGFAGTLAGALVLAAAARNGPGEGMLVASASGLAWQAPGSETAGAPQICAADGTYLLEDGEDQSKWIRVQVYVDYLPTSGSGGVTLTDIYNALGPDDVAAADASAGIVETTEFTLKNVSPLPVRGVALWIDPLAAGAAGLTVSSDGTNFFAPSAPNDPTALTWSSIAAGASVNLWMRRTVPGAAIYGSDQKPLQSLGLSYSDFAVSGSNMGYRFTANSDGRVTKLWMLVNDSSDHVVRLYRASDGTLIASGTITASADSWVSVDVAALLSAGDSYVVSGYFDTRRSHASPGFPVTSGDITINEGRYLDGSTAMPTIVDLTGLHGVDITFEKKTAAGINSGILLNVLQFSWTGL